jgi:hypothetical protein
MTRAVTSDTRPATKRKSAKARKMPQRGTVKRRDSFAQSLQDARFRKRVVKSAKLYSRKARGREEDETE